MKGTIKTDHTKHSTTIEHFGFLPQIPELKLLWELTGDSSEVLSRLCCNCLVQLVVDDHAEFEYIIRGLLSVAPSARWVLTPNTYIQTSLMLYTGQGDDLS